jgi:hypothetical protein
MSDKIDFNIKLEDLIKIVSNMGKRPEISASINEADELKKAWFRHIMFSLEKLSDKVEILEKRIEDLENK